jgi:hypothetical protein
MLPTPLRHTLWISLVVLFWVGYGLTGHDLWKTDELDALRSLEGAPHLYALVASLLAKTAVATGFDFIDGARLASGLFTLAALGFLALAAQRLLGAGFGVAAVLAAMGTFGLMLRAHTLTPELALYAGYALLLHGVSLHSRSSHRAALVMGVASVWVFAARGMVDLVAAWIIVFAPLAFQSWRINSYRRALTLYPLWLAVALLLWLALLSLHGGGASWWHSVTTWPRIQAPSLSMLTWFTWPLWPLALWAVWHERHRLARSVALQPLLIALVCLGVLSLLPAHSLEASALPLLAPLTLLAAQGVAWLRRGEAQGFYWFGALFFAFFAFAFWFYFSALQWNTHPRTAAHLLRLTPNYAQDSVNQIAVLLAVTATWVWIIVIPLFGRAAVRPVLVWATGMVLTWTLAFSLFGPWANAGWGYNTLVRDLHRNLPQQGCVTLAHDLPIAPLLRIELGTRIGQNCPWRIERAEGAAQPLWEGARPRDIRQRYRLVAN